MSYTELVLDLIAKAPSAVPINAGSLLYYKWEGETPKPRIIIPMLLRGDENVLSQWSEFIRSKQAPLESLKYELSFTALAQVYGKIRNRVKIGGEEIPKTKLAPFLFSGQVADSDRIIHMLDFLTLLMTFVKRGVPILKKDTTSYYHMSQVNRYLEKRLGESFETLFENYQIKDQSVEGLIAILGPDKLRAFLLTVLTDEFFKDVRRSEFEGPDGEVILQSRIEEQNSIDYSRFEIDLDMIQTEHYIMALRETPYKRILDLCSKPRPMSSAIVNQLASLIATDSLNAPIAFDENGAFASLSEQPMVRYMFSGNSFPDYHITKFKTDAPDPFLAVSIQRMLLEQYISKSVSQNRTSVTPREVENGEKAFLQFYTKAKQALSLTYVHKNIFSRLNADELNRLENLDEFLVTDAGKIIFGDNAIKGHITMMAAFFGNLSTVVLDEIARSIEIPKWRLGERFEGEDMMDVIAVEENWTYPESFGVNLSPLYLLSNWAPNPEDIAHASMHLESFLVATNPLVLEDVISPAVDLFTKIFNEKTYFVQAYKAASGADPMAPCHYYSYGGASLYDQCLHSNPIIRAVSIKKFTIGLSEGDDVLLRISQEMNQRAIAHANALDAIQGLEAAVRDIRVQLTDEQILHEYIQKYKFDGPQGQPGRIYDVKPTTILDLFKEGRYDNWAIRKFDGPTPVPSFFTRTLVPDPTQGNSFNPDGICEQSVFIPGNDIIPARATSSGSSPIPILNYRGSTVTGNVDFQLPIGYRKELISVGPPYGLNSILYILVTKHDLFQDLGI